MFDKVVVAVEWVIGDSERTTIVSGTSIGDESRFTANNRNFSKVTRENIIGRVTFEKVRISWHSKEFVETNWTT